MPTPARVVDDAKSGYFRAPGEASERRLRDERRLRAMLADMAARAADEPGLAAGDARIAGVWYRTPERARLALGAMLGAARPGDVARSNPAGWSAEERVQARAAARELVRCMLDLETVLKAGDTRCYEPHLRKRAAEQVRWRAKA